MAQTYHIIALYFALLCHGVISLTSPICEQPGCGCYHKNSNGKNSKTTLCQNVDNIESIYPNHKLPEDLFSIEFESNVITNVSRLFPSKLHDVWEKVKTLKLKKNGIVYIDNGAFKDFGVLQLLDLSDNEIGVISKEMFLGLGKLQKLYLADNNFPILPGNTFTSLPSLKRLDLTSSYLICNCLMADFVNWYQSNNPQKPLKLKLIGVCAHPPALKGTLLKKLKVKKLTCDALTELPYFIMQPSKRQVVFEDDSIPLHCEGTHVSASKIAWSHAGVDLNTETDFFNETAFHFPHRATISSHVQLNKITPRLSGTWKCSIFSNFSDVSEELDLVYVAKNAAYCNVHNVTNDHGRFEWPASVSGNTLSLPCQRSKLYLIGDAHGNASRTCLYPGTWAPANYSQCDYIDKTARLVDNVLHQNMTSGGSASKCWEASSQLQDSLVKRPVVVSLLIKLIKKCNSSYDSAVLLINEILAVPYEVLPDEPDQLTTVFGILHQAANRTLRDANAFEKVSTFLGTCGYVLNITGSEMLHCSVGSSKIANITCKLTKQVVQRFDQPSVIVPVDVGLRPPTLNVSVAVFRSGNLFQSVVSRTISAADYTALRGKKATPEEDRRQMNVLASSIYAVTINGSIRGNWPARIRFIFRTTQRVVPDRPKYSIMMWNDDTWIPTKGICHFNPSALPKQKNYNNLTVVDCTAFGSIALMKNLSIQDQWFPEATQGTLHITIYVGIGVLTLTLILIILTYLVFPNLKLSRDSRHTILNICIHFLFAALIFAVGIRRVDQQIPCYATGIILHYSSLAILLWITMSSRNICKEMLLSHHPPPLEPKPVRPILRFYLIGCGIPLIVCGITAAAKIQNYGGDGGQYCWLSWETSLYAFYGPAALIALYCVFVLLRILATLNCAPSGELNMRSRRLQNNTVTEETPLKNINEAIDRRTPSAPSKDALTPNKNADHDQSYRTRLRGVSLTLVFFIATWVCAALSVAAPRIQQRSDNTSSVNLSLVFSYLFATISVITAIFLFIQHLVIRNDVRMTWKYICISKSSRLLLSNRQSAEDSSGSEKLSNVRSAECRSGQNTSVTAVTDPTTIETILQSSGEGSQLNRSPHALCIASSGKNYGSSFIAHSASDVKNCNEHRAMTSRPSSSSAWNKVDDGKANAHYIDYRQQYNYYPHPYLRNGSKPIKMVNLQQCDSLTEHSLDEGHNMHTMPTIMQQTPRKLDNSALYHRRYQRMRRALDARRNKQKKLTVLREYAQDPLTSDDGGGKGRRSNTGRGGSSKDSGSLVDGACQKANPRTAFSTDPDMRSFTKPSREDGEVMKSSAQDTAHPSTSRWSAEYSTSYRSIKDEGGSKNHGYLTAGDLLRHAPKRASSGYEPSLRKSGGGASTCDNNSISKTKHSNQNVAAVETSVHELDSLIRHNETSV